MGANHGSARNGIHTSCGVKWKARVCTVYDRGWRADGRRGGGGRASRSGGRLVREVNRGSGEPKFLRAGMPIERWPISAVRSQKQCKHTGCMCDVACTARHVACDPVRAIRSGVRGPGGCGPCFYFFGACFFVNYFYTPPPESGPGCGASLAVARLTVTPHAG
jgi:hypothetical protein